VAESPYLRYPHLARDLIAFAADDDVWLASLSEAASGRGVDPDVEVTMAPHDWAAGRDPQLDTAVRLALQALEQRPPAAPPAV
jgi:C-terminal processing protease CtpA/Prc